MGILWNKFKSQENSKAWLCWEYHWVSCVSGGVRNEEKQVESWNDLENTEEKVSWIVKR
jgi:hypothetical protein